MNRKKFTIFWIFLLSASINAADDGLTKNIYLEPEMLLIKAGTSTIGCLSSVNCGELDLKPTKVKVNDFWIGKFEITFKEWDKCAASGACREIIASKSSILGEDIPLKGNVQNLPVATVSWQDVMSYLEWLNQKTNKNYRLPTEAEWEYAARAGSKTKYPEGNSVDCSKYHIGACENKYSGRAVDVGSYQPNGFGLYDMFGNVYEWTCSKPDSIEVCAPDEYQGERIVKGGSFDTVGTSGLEVRIPFDTVETPPGFLGIGFRLAYDAK